MRRLILAVLAVCYVMVFTGCAGVRLSRLGISVTVANAFSAITAGTAPVTLQATTDDDPTNAGVSWQLSIANTACSPGCGVLTRSTTNPRYSAIYTPPASPPLNANATIIAISNADKAATYAFNFTITPSIAVSITNKFPSLFSGTPAVTVNATVSNDLAKAGVSWTLTAGNPAVNCAPACGTLTVPSSPAFSASYLPPQSAPTGANDTPTITATSVTDPTKNDSFNFTINQSLVVTISDKFAFQNAGDSAVSVDATVTADPANAGVSWTLTAGTPPANCSPACGTLTVPAAPTFSASYLPPAIVPAGTNDSPTITATSVTDTTKNDSFNFTIRPPATVFKGNYAFLLRGYDVTGSPMSMAGSVTADGHGNITGGELDNNNGGGITTVPSPLLGTYSLDPPFNGAVRGTITISNFTFPDSSTQISLRFTLSSDGKRGRIVELDGIGFRNVGTIQLQDPASLAAANPAGTYVFGLDSDAPVGGRTVEAGQFVLTTSGVTGGLVDESKAGDPTPRYSAAPLSPGSSTPPDSSGRGTLTLSVGATASGPASTSLYAYYIVNSGQLNLIQIDPSTAFGTVQAGVARIQNPLTLSSVNATSVLQFTGMDAIPGTSNGIGPDVIIGVIKISGGNSYNLNFDINDLGLTVLPLQNVAGAVIFDPSTGRGILSSPGSFENSFVDKAVFYLSDVGQGFIIDADPSTPNGTPPAQAITNNAFSGTLIPQASGPFDPNTSLSNNLIFSSGATAIPAIPNIEGVVSVNDTAQTYSGLADLTAPDPIDNEPNASFTGTFTPPDPILGHGFIQLPQAVYGHFTGNALFPATYFLIGPNQFVSIGDINGAMSGISIFEPQ